MNETLIKIRLSLVSISLSFKLNLQEEAVRNAYEENKIDLETYSSELLGIEKNRNQLTELNDLSQYVSFPQLEKIVLQLEEIDQETNQYL